MGIKKLASIVFALVLSTNLNASIVNPSFEDSTSLTGWDIVVNGSFDAFTETGFVTDGVRSMRIWSRSTCAYPNVCGGISFTAGDYISVSQSIDMSSMNSIIFDAKLTGYGTTAYQSFIEAAVYIDSTEVWSSQTVGEYYDVSIDTSLFAGAHSLEFRMLAIGDGVDSQSDWFYVDNIRANYVPIPAAIWLFGSGLIGLIGVVRRKKA